MSTSSFPEQGLVIESKGCGKIPRKILGCLETTKLKKFICVNGKRLKVILEINRQQLTDESKSMELSFQILLVDEQNTVIEIYMPVVHSNFKLPQV